MSNAFDMVAAGPLARERKFKFPADTPLCADVLRRALFCSRKEVQVPGRAFVRAGCVAVGPLLLEKGSSSSRPTLCADVFVGTAQ